MSAQKSGKKSTMTVLGIVLIAAIAAAYFFLFAGRISEADLVRETTSNTTYLRPKQWQAMRVFETQGISSYGDTGGDGEKLNLNSLVMFKETSSMPQLASASEEMLDQLRQQLLSGAPSRQFNLDAPGSMPCDSTSDPKLEADTKKNDTTTGLVISSSTCESSGKKVTTKIRAVMGRDGTARVITIMARDESWRKNEKIFQSMLESVEQAG